MHIKLSHAGILVIIALLLGIAIGFFIYSRVEAPSSAPIPNLLAKPSNVPALADLIYVDRPLDRELLRSPFTVSGRARGNWYFEASFPVILKDGNGKILVQLPAQAQSNWMTMDFVPFKAVLEFSKPATDSGMLILKNDNPSGDPAKSKELDIPVQFGK